MKRYDIDGCIDATESKDGEWVKYSEVMKQISSINEFNKCDKCNGSGRMPMLRNRAEVLQERAFNRMTNGL